MIVVENQIYFEFYKYAIKASLNWKVEVKKGRYSFSDQKIDRINKKDLANESSNNQIRIPKFDEYIKRKNKNKLVNDHLEK